MPRCSFDGFLPSKTKSEYEISFDPEGKVIRARDDRPLSDKICEIKNSLVSNGVAFKSGKLAVNNIFAITTTLYC